MYTHPLPLEPASHPHPPGKDVVPIYMEYYSAIKGTKLGHF